MSMCGPFQMASGSSCFDWLGLDVFTFSRLAHSRTMLTVGRELEGQAPGGLRAVPLPCQ